MTGLTPGRSVLGGGAVLMTCACGTAAGAAKLMGMPGGPGMGGGVVTTSILHSVLLGVGAALMVYGLSRISSFAAWLAVTAFAVLAAAASITKPSVMTPHAMPW
ncbi:MAG: hypothetical protein H0U85_03820, partial [Gemmatimonadales bacterium]|nr:hypothetical protein [Gemmatimonadales bacterium]